MDDTNLIYALEAVLFASGESIKASRLASVLGVSEEDIAQMVSQLSDQYDFDRRGVKLIRLDDKYQIVSRPEYSEYVRSALESGKPPMLSHTAMEVLAIVAYRQPVTKAYIEQIRGVDSSYTVGSLMDKGLLEECGRLDVPGRPILYKTSERFLRSFGLSEIEQLPYIEGFDIQNMGEQLSLEGGIIADIENVTEPETVVLNDLEETEGEAE